MFLEPYWMRHAADSAVVVSGWHRLSYYSDDGEYQSVELERHIRLLHRAVGNAVADDKNVVFGTGSMKLINALVHTLASAPDTTPARVVATAPYYAVPSSSSSSSSFLPSNRSIYIYIYITRE
jgi:histidinol-phosphate/aromatic aminotransferase/cobyric acid decarboxylase-like protein